MRRFWTARASVRDCPAGGIDVGQGIGAMAPLQRGYLEDEERRRKTTPTTGLYPVAVTQAGLRDPLSGDLAGVPTKTGIEAALSAAGF